MNPPGQVPPREAPAPRRPQQRQRGPEDIYNDIRDELKNWARSACAYAVLSAAIESRLNPDPNARMRAAPLLTTPPVAFGGEQFELVFDPNKTKTEEFEYLLVPLLNLQIPLVTEAMDRLSMLVAELRTSQKMPPIPTGMLSLLNSQLAAQPSQPQAPSQPPQQ